jgi:hypothetical protein
MAAKEKKIPVIRRAEMLAEITRMTFPSGFMERMEKQILLLWLVQFRKRWFRTNYHCGRESKKLGSSM